MRQRQQLTQHQFGWYGQDDWRLRKNLSLSLGLRHEVQTQFDDANNFAPRLGLAWSPFKQGHLTVRGGAGIYYEWFGAETAEQLLRVNGTQQREIVILNPNYPDPFSSGGQANSLPASRLARDPFLRLPSLLRASVGLEQHVGKKMSLFSLQVSNLFNHVNYTTFSGVRTSPFFEQPIAAASGRRTELGMRFSF